MIDLQGECEAIAGSCVMFKTRQCARAVTSLYEEVLKPSGLSPAQLSLLVTLHLVSDVNISSLATMLVMDRTTLSRNLKPLLSAGLIATTRAIDPRSRWIKLTDQGRERLAYAIPLWKQAQARIVGQLGEARWTALHQELSRLVEVARMG